MKTLICRHVCLFVLLVFLAGCSGPAKSVAPALTLISTGVPSSTATTELPTATPIVKPVSSTLTSEVLTDTPVLEPTPTTPAPHSTPAPTLTDAEEQTLVLDLLRKNSGCRLPCWWGFTPGKTAWQTAENFFASHGKEIEEYRDSQITNYTIYYDIPQHGSQINQDYYTVNGDTIDVIAIRAVPPVRDDKLVYGDAKFAEDLKPYMLSPMLSVYGQPSQVFLRTFSDAPTGWLPYNLLLFYPEQGMLVSYYGPVEKDKETLRACLDQTDVRLWLWSPAQTMSLERVANMGGSPIGDMSGFRSLEEATGMSVDKFYETFKKGDIKACFETPVYMW